MGHGGVEVVVEGEFGAGGDGFFGEEELQPANESRLAARKTVRRLARISR